jgi:succinoglycan biosynthesis protein ExoM
MVVTAVIPRERERVAVCVCTCKRPLMLRKCLDSLGSQLVPEHVKPLIIVVDNEDAPNNQSVVELFDKTSPYPVYYEHEPVRGIDRVRNKTLEVAQQLGVGWIAFIDDDAEADEDWLANLMSPEYLSTPVLVGNVQYRVTQANEDSDAPKQAKRKQEGELLTNGRTGNVRFSISLVEAGLKFDEALNLTGGEDVRFFKDAQKLGFETRYTGKAIVNESVHPSRQNLRFQTYRHFAHCAAQASHKIRDGKRASVAMSLAKLLVVYPPLALVEMSIGRRLKGAKRLARIAGIAAALRGRLPTPYLTIHGE